MGSIRKYLDRCGCVLNMVDCLQLVRLSYCEFSNSSNLIFLAVVPVHSGDLTGMSKQHKKIWSRNIYSFQSDILINDQGNAILDCPASQPSFKERLISHRGSVEMSDGQLLSSTISRTTPSLSLLLIAISILMAVSYLKYLSIPDCSRIQLIQEHSDFSGHVPYCYHLDAQECTKGLSLVSQQLLDS